MTNNLNSEVLVPGLVDVMPGDYSLGVPIENGTIQVGTAVGRDPDGPRLHVVGNEEAIEISRQDLVPLQAVAFDHELKAVTNIFAEPVGKLILGRAGHEKYSDLWLPISEGASVASEDGLRQFLTVIAREAHYKQMTSRLSVSF